MKSREEIFLYKLEQENPFIFKDVLFVYPIKNWKEVSLETKYGKVTSREPLILKWESISLRSAENKADFWVRRNESIREDYNDIDYSFCNYVNNSIKVQLRCKKHDYTYYQRPSHHTAGVQGCAHCMTQTIMYTKENIESHKDFIKSIKGVLYVLKLENKEESFYKIGIVSKHRFDYRMSQYKSIGFKVSVLYTADDDMVSTFEVEQKFLEEFKEHRYTPKIKFVGYTECLKVNPIEYYYYYYNLNN